MTNKDIGLNTTQKFQELPWDKIANEWEEVFNSFEGNRFFQSEIVKNIWKKNRRNLMKKDVSSSDKCQKSRTSMIS